MKRRKIIFSILISIIVLFITALSFATVLFKSYVVTKGDETIGSMSKVVDINDSSKDAVLIDCSTYNLTFTRNGELKDLNISVNNRTNLELYYEYDFKFDSSSFTLDTESFASAILVYYNDVYIGTLANLCSNENYTVSSNNIKAYGYIDKAINNYASVSDKISFELDNLSNDDIYEFNKPFSFNLSLYAHSADYSHNIFVHNETELLSAFNDINSQILDEQNIVLMDDITFNDNIVLKDNVDIDLNGYVLTNNGTITFASKDISRIKSNRKINKNINQNGSYIIDNAEGLLLIDDMNGKENDYSSSASAINYSISLLKDYAVSKALANTRYGILSGSSVNLFNGLSFYNINLNLNTLTYENPYLIAPLVDITQTYDITLFGLNLPIKVYQNGDEAILNSILENELKYLTDLTVIENGVIKNTTSADLLLPSFVRDKNTTITWESSNPKAISDKGIISSTITGDQVVSLFGHFKVNNSVFTHEFKLRVASQNHETIFQYLVAQISPINIETMFNGSNQDNAFYRLPIVDDSFDPLDIENYNGYDYRSSYETPLIIEEGKTKYLWDGFINAGFEYIRYSNISTYSFLAVDEASNSVYLATPTFQTFGQIKISAKFKNEPDVYTGNVNIIISTGYNTELNELVFNYVDKELTEINILQNILNTRKENGMASEIGDFYLNGNYQTYYITYAIPESSKNAIKEIIGYDETDSIVRRITFGQTFTSSDVLRITKYKIVTNPSGFGLNDSQCGITTILVMPTGTNVDTATKIQYFEIPGVIKPDNYGFSNLSVFNSVKYQVWYELAHNVISEKGDSNVLDDDYTLLSDTNSFTVANNVVTNNTGAYILRHDASLVSTLAFDVSENNINTDNHIIYGLIKVIDFITSDSQLTFSAKYNNDISFANSFISSHSNIKSNGKKFLNDNEKALLNDYYTTYISSSFDINEYTYIEKDKQGISKYTLINSANFFDDVHSYYSMGTPINQYWSKFMEVFQWGHNDKNFAEEFYPYNPPNYGVIGGNIWSGVLNLPSTSWTYKTNTNYNNSDFMKRKVVEDQTEYFTSDELEVLLVFMLNSFNAVPSANARAKVQQIRDDYFVIPYYFNNDAIGKIITKAYNDLNIDLEGFTSELSSFDVCGQNYITPHVTCLDNSTGGLEYFDNLTTLYIHGSYQNLRAIHTTNNLIQTFNRITDTHDKLINLAFEYTSDSNMDFDISNVGNLRKLKRLSFGHNQGISNIGSIHMLVLRQLEYVDLSDINVTNEFSKFTLQSINYKTSLYGTSSSVYYSLDGQTSKTLYTEILPQDAEGLIYLSDFTQLLGENANLTERVYVDDNGYDVEWLIEEGNGITLIDTNTTYSLNQMTIPFTNTYFVTNDFVYSNITFEANRLYQFYLNANQLAFKKLTDAYGDEIVLNYGTPADSLTDEEVDAFMASHTIPTTTQTHDKVNEGAPTKTVFPASNIPQSNNRYPSGVTSSNRWYNNGTPTTMRVYEENNDTPKATLNVYGVGIYQSLNNSSKIRTITQTSYVDSYNNFYNYEQYKYYASLNQNGTYNITRYTYQVQRSDVGVRQFYNDVITEKVIDIYYTTTRSGSFYNYTYQFLSLWDNYPNAVKLSVGSTTYDLTSNQRRSQTTNSTPTTSESTNNWYRNSNMVQNSAQIEQTSMSLSNEIIDSMITALNDGYITTTNAVSYYTNGTSTTITAGTKTISLSSDGVFSYQNADSNANIAFYMINVLREANASVGTIKAGLYYNHYYAYNGPNITVSGYSFVNKGVYRLMSNGEVFEFVRESGNAASYQEITGDYLAITDVMAQIDSSYLNRIYYYSGTSNQGNTQGSNLFYQVIYNTDSGAYEMKKFGVMDTKYDICYNGDFHNVNYLNQHSNPSKNTNGLGVVTNLMKYLDNNYFTNGTVNTTYTMGVGGTRNAVIKAVINVNGVNYERLFLVKVTG